jgi:Putative viral replication protein.
MEKTQRATCWSITINNPSEGELKCDAPGWKLQGQFEEGNEGTRHFQGMLETPQVRFSAVKRVFPRAHIEVAKNKKALQAYVNKQETRVGTYEAQAVPNMFQLQDSIASDWDDDEWRRRLYINVDQDDDVRALEYLDTLVATRIENGQRGIEFIAINPMWRSSWKKFWLSIIIRNARLKEEADRRSNEESKEESP